VTGTFDHLKSAVKSRATANDVLFDFATLPAKEGCKLLPSTVVTRPIAWILTLDSYRRLNTAPFSFSHAFFLVANKRRR
jgi:hypothetical protein